jgi:hypothetical protein
MNKYVIHDNDGNIISCGISSEVIDQRISLNHTQVWVDYPDDIENYRFDTASNSLVHLGQDIIDERETLEAWNLLRSSRDSRLTSSDWTQAADSPLSDAKKAEWATYRQQLRDLPANTTDPANPTWPTPPS